MAYRIKTTRQFLKDFEKLDSKIQNRTLIAIEGMRINPLHDVKKLINVDAGVFRKRVGDYRIRFDIIGKEVFLYRIRDRKDVYR